MGQMLTLAFAVTLFLAAFALVPWFNAVVNNPASACFQERTFKACWETVKDELHRS